MNTATTEKTPEIKQVQFFDDRFYKVTIGDVVDYYPSTTTVLGTVAKPFLARWRGDIGNREADLRMDQAGERGTRLHLAWNTYLQDGAVIYQPDLKPNYTYEEMDAISAKHIGNLFVLKNQDEMYQMLKLKKWYEAMNPIKTMTEQIVYSLLKRRAGTLDNLFALEEGKYLVNGSKPLVLQKGLYIADLKTGQSADDDMFMQIADYAFSFEEMAKSGVEWASELYNEFGPVVGGFIIHTGSKTKSGIEGLSTLLRTREELEQDLNDMDNVHKIWLRKHKDAKPEIFEFPAMISKRKE